MAKRGAVKLAMVLGGVAATALAIVFLARDGEETRDEVIVRAERLVRVGGAPCRGTPTDPLNVSPPTSEFFEGSRLYHRFVGEEHSDVVRGLGPRAQIRRETRREFFDARSERLRSLSGDVWTAQSNCLGAFVHVCMRAESRSDDERTARCEPWREYARWLRDELHFDLPELGQCGGCAYLFE